MNNSDEKGTVSDWRQARRKPEYEELNRILDESPAVQEGLSQIRGKTQAKQNVLRDFLWWAKTKKPSYYERGPDGLISYQKSARAQRVISRCN